MRRFWEIIPRYILKNKKRVLFIGIGIILSISLIISLSIIADVLKSNAYESITEYSGGSYDIRFQTIDYEKFEELKTDPIIDKISIVTSLGVHKVQNSRSLIDIKGYDKNITELLNFKLVEGKHPNTGNEIALEKWVIDVLPERYKVGDTIKLPYTIDYMNSSGKRTSEETEDEFILTGIFEHTAKEFSGGNSAKGYVTEAFVENKLTKKDVEYFGYIAVKPGYSIPSALIQLSSTRNYSSIEFNQNFTKTSTFESGRILDIIIKILYAIIGCVASVIIFNVFSISITERIKEFGMLRAVGASPLRIRLLVLGEGLLLGLVFIPLGIVVGGGFIKILIMTATGSIKLDGLFNIPRTGIIAALAVGILTILAGVYFPALKASKVSPMEAITSNNNLELKGRKIKSKLQCDSFIRRRFKFTANMAYLNLNRNKKKFITTVISLSITIMMFISVKYLVDLLDPARGFLKSFRGDFRITSQTNEDGYGITGDDIDSLSKVKGIQKISTEKNINTNVEVPEERVTSEGMKYFEFKSKNDKYNKMLFDTKQFVFEMKTLGYNQEELESLKTGLVDGQINISEIKEKPIAIVAQNLNYYNYTDIKVGDTIKIRYFRYDENGNRVAEPKVAFTVGAIVKEEMLKSVDMRATSMIIVSEEAAAKYLEVENYQQANIILNKAANYEVTENEIKEIIKRSRNLTVKSFKEELKEVKKHNMKISVAMYSFVFIVGLVSVINLINIMYMNVILRNREIGMMRALGLGSDEVKKMIRDEGLFHGVVAALAGSLLGVLLTYMIYITGRHELMQGMTWEFPLASVVITFTGTLIITFIASVLPSRRLFTSSIVESIRGIE